MRKLLSPLLLFWLFSCQMGSRQSDTEAFKKVELITPSGESIETTLVVESREQEQGLSGVRSADFSENQGMLFYYLTEDERHFWMPDTYFDLDLFYLDKELRIIDVIRRLPFYVGRNNPELIPRARGIWARHVLEMKAASPVSRKLKVGDVLKWVSPFSLSETDEAVKKILSKP